MDFMPKFTAILWLSDGMEVKEYWPFEVLPTDQQTDHHRHVVAYLKQALAEGFNSYEFDWTSYGASASNGRSGDLIKRGFDRYEVILKLADEVIASFYVDGFVNASEATLEWLRGQEAKFIKEHFKKFIISPGVLSG
jgi:hypothetical protein